MPSLFILPKEIDVYIFYKGKKTKRRNAFAAHYCMTFMFIIPIHTQTFLFALNYHFRNKAAGFYAKRSFFFFDVISIGLLNICAGSIGCRSVASQTKRKLTYHLDQKKNIFSFFFYLIVSHKLYGSEGEDEVFIVCLLVFISILCLILFY